MPTGAAPAMGSAASCAARVVVFTYPTMLKLAKRKRRAPALADGDAPPEARAVEPAPAVRVPPIALGEREAYEEGMETTPKSAAKREYAYFCPICMRHFRAVYETQCCRNYVCRGCARDFVGRHERLAAKAHLHDGEDGLGPLRCPACNVEKFALVAATGPVRSYDDDDGVPVASLDSPVRIGDSYETLRRKMLSYEETGCCRDNVRKLFADGDGDDGAAGAGSPPRAAAEPISDAQAFARTFVMPILAA